MRVSLKAIFAQKAGALLLAGSMAGSPVLAGPREVPRADKSGRTNISALVPRTGSACVPISKVANPATAIERYVANMYENNRQTAIGRMLFDADKDPELQVCFEHAMNDRNACGFYVVGQLRQAQLMLNPGEDISDILRNSTAIHEIRHRFQISHGMVNAAAKNLPPEVRVEITWFQEADARMVAILYAWEWDKKGNGAYKDLLMREDGYQGAVEAFYAAIGEQPDDVAGAARAAVMAWLKNGYYKRNYANNAADYNEQNLITFDSNLPVDDVFSAERMMELGDIGEYGNYMNQDVIDAFTHAYTAEEYAQLDARRKAAPKGRACAP